MGLDGGQRPRLTCDRCGRPTWRLWRVWTPRPDGTTEQCWICPRCRKKEASK